VSSNYRIPSSGLSRGHPIDQVKMFKKNCCHFEKTKLPIFVQKYLINILAMLYFPFEQKLEKENLFFRDKTVFSRNVFSFIF
jgi:hypothetical protein